LDTLDPVYARCYELQQRNGNFFGFAMPKSDQYDIEEIGIPREMGKIAKNIIERI
jgi:hypothetical protein